MKKQKRFSSLSQEERQVISLKLVHAVSMYLQQFISPIIARRIVSALLVVAGVRNSRVTELTGLCERGISDLKNRLMGDDIDSLFKVKDGRGRKSKVKDVESQIVEEVEKGNYQTLRQIADMIREKFSIAVAVMAVSRLLKKRDPEAEGGFPARQGRHGGAAQFP